MNRKENYVKLMKSIVMCDWSVSASAIATHPHPDITDGEKNEQNWIELIASVVFIIVIGLPYWVSFILLCASAVDLDPRITLFESLSL